MPNDLRAHQSQAKINRKKRPTWKQWIVQQPSCTPARWWYHIMPHFADTATRPVRHRCRGRQILCRPYRIHLFEMDYKASISSHKMMKHHTDHFWHEGECWLAVGLRTETTSNRRNGNKRSTRCRALTWISCISSTTLALSRLDCSSSATNVNHRVAHMSSVIPRSWCQLFSTSSKLNCCYWE